MLELVTTKNGDIVGRPSLVIDFGVFTFALKRVLSLWLQIVKALQMSLVALPLKREPFVVFPVNAKTEPFDYLFATVAMQLKGKVN